MYEMYQVDSPTEQSAKTSRTISESPCHLGERARSVVCVCPTVRVRVCVGVCVGVCHTVYVYVYIYVYVTVSACLQGGGEM
jgi:hypothetical protein